jgi:hypothetical protein
MPPNFDFADSTDQRPMSSAVATKVNPVVPAAPL